MTDPQIILDDIIRGNSFYTNLIHNEIATAQRGLDKGNCGIESQSLLFILKALIYRTEQDKFDEITEKLYRCLIKIIGTYIAPTNVRFYYGLRDTDDTLSLSEITTASYIEGSSGTEPIIPYLVDAGPKFAWMAEFSSETIKTKWQDTVFLPNNGDIGINSDDLFRVPIIVNIFRTYITDYETEFVYPIQFKKV